MTIKYKVVKKPVVHRARRPPQWGRYDVPVDAAYLAQDIAMIELAISILSVVDPINLTASETQEQRDYGSAMLQSQIMLLRTWHRYAKRKLATKYLAP